MHVELKAQLDGWHLYFLYHWSEYWSISFLVPRSKKNNCWNQSLLQMHKSWRRIIPYILIAVFCGWLLSDINSSPVRQVITHIYVGMVKQYQHFVRPIIHGFIVCRFQPSCSNYSIIAVKKHGLMQGLILTFKRVSRCGENIPIGTVDQVPEIIKN